MLPRMEIEFSKGKISYLLILISMVLLYSEICTASQMTSESSDQNFFFALTKLAEDAPAEIVSSVIAKRRFEQGKFRQALKFATATLAKEPENIDGQGIAGVIHAFSGQVENARERLGRLKENDRGKFYFQLINAMLSAQTNDLKTAEIFLLESLKEQPDHPVSIYYRGSLNLAQNKNEAAAELFKKVLGNQPEFVPALAGLAQVYSRRGDLKKAISHYEKALALDPGNRFYRKQLLELHRACGNKIQADHQVKMMLYHTPGLKEEYLKKGRKMLVTGDYDAAIALMEKMEKIYNDMAGVHFIKAVAYSNKGDRDKAMESIAHLVRNRGDNPLSYHYAGMCLMALESYKEAEGQFIKAIGLNPNMGKSFVPLTLIEQINGNFKKAHEGLTLVRRGGEPAILIDYFSAHIFLEQGNDQAFLQKMKSGAKLIPGLNPDRLASPTTDAGRTFFCKNRNLMMLFFVNGWYGKALEISCALLEQNREDRFALYFKALCETAQGKSRAGIGTYARLINLEDRLYSAYMGMGKLYLEIKDIENAVASFKHVTDIRPSFVPAYGALGDAYQAGKKTARAIENYKAALSINPQAIGIYPKLILLLSEQEARYPEAARYSKRLESFSPEDPFSIDAIGWIHLKLANYEKGRDLIRKAYKKAPEDPLILYHLGVLNYQSKDMKSAKKYLSASINKSNNFPGHAHALSILDEINSLQPDQ